jgi:hypothetical protein
MSYVGTGYRSRRLLLTLALAVSLGASALAQDKSKISGATALQPGTTYTVGTTGPAGGARVQGQAVTPAEKRVSVIVKLTDKSLAAYKGGVAGMAPTSPAATRAPSLDINSSASQQYLAYLNHD